ncbi:MAG: hypothetical protein V4660_03165 [Pseudomonadota bacterium]
MKTSRLLLTLFSTSLLFACSSNHANKNPVKEISICSNEKCDAAAQTYSAEQLLSGFQQLLIVNENESVPMCNADPKTHLCKSAKVCHFVLGGIIPGNGCSKNLTFSEVANDKQTTQLTMKTKMPLTFIGTPVNCSIADSIVSVGSVNDISIQLKPHFCSWMVVGAMTAKLIFQVESINLERGEIGGYWTHSVKGTGMGRGSGYLVLKFPKNISWKKADLANNNSAHSF